jgi:hypothetical protein
MKGSDLMALKCAILGSIAVVGIAGFASLASADNDDLKCTTAEKSSWMSEDATKDLLKQQGYKDVRDIEVTDGNCYEVYAIDAQDEKVEIYLDPTNGKLISKED